ncbi:MAG: polyisoprenoid-binding protein [Deltaproteobacteria bacterium]|nr:MAG: polyisoprenoid-binding protein [Deltaproteobacteria bacterium]
MTRSILLLGALSLPATAAASTWQIDPKHTTVGFKVKHMMVSYVEGRFHEVEGTVEYDPANPTALSATVTVQMDSVDTHEPKRDAHLKSPDFFDVEKYPTMTFKSTAVKQVGDGELDVTGDLTLHGVTRPIVLHVEGLGQPIIDPWGNERVGAEVTGSLNRQDFGVSWSDTLDGGGLVVDDIVKLDINVELVRPAGK